MKRNLIIELKKTETHPLKGFFKSKKITHHQLATLCDCGTSTITAYMNGYLKVPPMIEQILNDQKEEIQKSEGTASYGR